MSERVHAVVAAARRLRPRTQVEIRGETFTVRMPSMAAIQEYQNHHRDAAKRLDAIRNLFEECICDGDGETTLSQDDAAALASMPWFVTPMLREILRVVTEDPEVDNRQPGHADPAPQPEPTPEEQEKARELAEKKD